MEDEANQKGAVPGREEVLRALSLIQGPVSAGRVAARLQAAGGRGEEASVGRVLHTLGEEGTVRWHRYPLPASAPPPHPTTTERTLYWLPRSAQQSQKAEVPGTPLQCTTSSSTTTPPPSSTPSSPSKSNHLSNQMSSSLRARLRGRRSVVASPFKSPLKRKEPDSTDSEPKTTQSAQPAKQARLDATKSSYAERRELERAIKSKEARLAELKRKRLLAEQKFSNKEEREKVPRLIDKWRQVCQEVLVQLHSHHVQEKPELTLAELVEYLNIDAAAIRFSPADETFY